MENKDNEKSAYSFKPSLCSDESSSFGRSLDPLFNSTCEKLNTQLIESIPDGNITHMKRIIAMGASPNTSSACHIAAMFDNDALDLLLSSGADSSRPDRHGRTPLHLAAWTGNVKHIAVLLNFPEALRKSVADQVVLSPETLVEVALHSLSVNKWTNLPCRPNVESTLAGDWSDGVEHCDSIKEMLPVFEQEWTALHAASARAQHHCVQLLLAAGADGTAQDLLYRTPLDVAGSAYYLGHQIDVNNFMKTVDLLLKAGGKFFTCYNSLNLLSTPLHTAVELKSKAAVEQMLRGGASATVWNRWGLTAMHVCAHIQDKELLQLLANHKSLKSKLNSIDVVDRSGHTVLYMAVQAEWLHGVRIALAAGATNVKYFVPGINSQSDESTVFHLATRLGSKDVLEHLLNYYNHGEVKKHINTSDHFGPPSYYAIDNNNVDCARLLIYKGAKLNADGHNRLLNLAVKNNNTMIAEMIIKTDVATLHAVNRDGRSPLYEACSHGHREMITLLLRNGADLSGGETENGRKFVPIENLMNNFSKPTEFLQDIFDSNIESFLQKDDYDKVFVNFQILTPKHDRKKMKVIKALLKTGNRYDQQKLLLHPLVESFLFLQWKSLLPFFYIILALHVCFVLSLNVFALSLFWYTDRKIEPVPIVFRSDVWIYIIYLATFLLTVQEVIIIQIKTKIRYRICLEPTVKCLSTILAVALPQVVSWDSKSNPEWARLFVSVTLLLAWVRMMYLLSRLPDFGYYVLMYGRVATKVFKILVSFGFLIAGFGVCFMIHFHAQQPFEDPLSSLLTTMVMMTSELGYNEIINKKSVEHAPTSLIMIRLIFVSFLILVSIILMNLLVGVAVNDVSTLEIIGNINRLKKQVQFIKSFEDTACNHFIANILPASLYKRWFEDNIPMKFYVKKRQTRNDNHGLPTRLIEAIFENVQLQKRKSHEKLGTKLYQTKLDDIHKVIVKKDTGKPAKPEIPDNAKLLEEMKLKEEIIKLRTDMELLKTISVKIADALNVVISDPNQR